MISHKAKFVNYFHWYRQKSIKQSLKKNELDIWTVLDWKPNKYPMI